MATPYDVCIIGSGAAGGMTAYVLTKAGLNVAMLGALSALLDIPEAAWLDAIHARLAAKLHRLNDEAFAAGRKAAERLNPTP